MDLIPMSTGLRLWLDAVDTVTKEQAAQFDTNERVPRELYGYRWDEERQAYVKDDESA